MLKILQNISFNRKNGQSSGDLQELQPLLNIRPIADAIERPSLVIENQIDFRNYIIQNEEIDFNFLLNFLICLPLKIQELILNDIFNDFTHPFLQKIMLLKYEKGVENAFLIRPLVAELMARHQLYKYERYGGIGFLVPNTNKLRLPPEKEKLFRRILVSRELMPKNLIDHFSHKYAHWTDDDRVRNYDAIVAYLEELPFPVNIMYLSEALRPNTRWNYLFASEPNFLIENPYQFLYKNMTHILIKESLDKCLAEARQNNRWSNNMAPEIKLIITRLEQEDRTSIDYSLGFSRKEMFNVCRLLTEPFLSDESRRWAQKPKAKKAVLDFIDAIPDEQRKEEYKKKMREHSPLSEFLNIRVKTFPETIRDPMVRRLLTWKPSPNLPPIHNRVTTVVSQDTCENESLRF